MKQSEINHLRRLIGWARCEVGQPPEELVTMVQDFAQRGLDMSNDHAQRAMVEAHDRARSVPKYIREAITALEKYVGTVHPAEDAEPSALKLEQK